MDHSLNEMVYSLRRSDIRIFSALAKETPGCLSLTLGEPDFDTPAGIEAEVNAAIAAHETHYIPNDGTIELRQKIAEFENEHNGHSYSWKNVIVTAGASEGLFLSCLGILNPSEEAIIVLPAYPAYAEDVKIARGTPVFLNTAEDNFQIKKEKLEKLITSKTRMIILNTPNNPTGTVLNEESLKTVHDVVKGKNIFVIADDVYQQLRYSKDVHSITEYEDIRDQLILVQSFSKPYAMTGWRMGYLCADVSVVERLELLHQFMITSTPSLFQRAAVKALSYDPSEFLKIYTKRRQFILSKLTEIGLDTVRPDGAFYVFPSIKKFGISSADFCTRMIKEAGLAAVPGSAFGAEGYIRLSYCYSDAVLEEGMKRLNLFVRKLEGENG